MTNKERIVVALAGVAVAVTIGYSAMVVEAVNNSAENQIEQAEQDVRLYAAQLRDVIQNGALPAGMTTEYLGEFECSAYCAEEYPHICGGNGITSSGSPVTVGLTVAVDPEVIPLGSILYIEDVGIRIAQDTGSAVIDNRIDVAVETHAEAESWAGYGTHKVWILGKDG